MSERKVLNKYYPPDFDPSKIPRMKLPKNRQYTVRLMAPFNMRCATCGEYIYKGKKFNARKEDVENETYLGIRIYRFYIKCTRCLQEISFKTDPKSTDYEIEAGATRNFMALKLAEEQAVREEEEAKEEEASNPMKLLENRTKQSKNEIELLESLEELKDLNKRQQAVDYDSMLVQYDTTLTQREKEEKLKQLDEDFIKSVKFKSTQKRNVVVEEEIIEDFDDEPAVKSSKYNDASTNTNTTSGSTNVSNVKPTTSSSTMSWNKSIGGRSTKSSLTGLVKIKTGASTRAKMEQKSSDNLQKSEVKLAVANTKAKMEQKSSDNIEKSEEASPEETVVAAEKPTGNGLSLLGTYSDSESNSD